MDMALQLLVAVLIGLTLSSLPQSECYQPKQGVADGKELLACPPPVRSRLYEDSSLNYFVFTRHVIWSINICCAKTIMINFVQFQHNL